MQAFRGNFFAETGTENAPKRKRTAKANPAARSRLTSTSTRLTNDAAKFSTFFAFGGQVGCLASKVDLTFEKKTIMEG